ncbi:hypothetical protein cypCar_00016869 [Cyprinus carpio]|nr:hypothetical protein cypCar_00016869 [Cyprinus carpio]
MCFDLTRNEELRQSQAASVEHMEKYEAKHMGGFHRIFPREGREKYEKYFQHNSSLFRRLQPPKPGRSVPVGLHCKDFLEAEELLHYDAAEGLYKS